MSDQLLQTLGDIAYSRTVFCRRALTNPQLDTLLSNEARMLRLIERDSYNNIVTSFLSANIPVNITHGAGANAFWDPVTVAATPAQQAAATVDFTPNPESTDLCCICQDRLTATPACKLNTCQHALHRSCASQWFSMSTRCPVCRASIV
jgi:hypothetical protein